MGTSITPASASPPAAERSRGLLRLLGFGRLGRPGPAPTAGPDRSGPAPPARRWQLMFASFKVNARWAPTMGAMVAGVAGFFTVLRGAAFAAHSLPNGAFAGAAGAIPVVGALLIFSLLVGPPAAARALTGRPSTAVPASVLACLVTMWAAIAASYETSLPVGFFVGAFSALLYGGARMWAARR